MALSFLLLIVFHVLGCFRIWGWIARGSFAKDAKLDIARLRWIASTFCCVVASPSRRLHWHVQRRRLYYHGWCQAVATFLSERAPQQAAEQSRRRKTFGEEYDMHDYHEAVSSAFYLIPQEVAECCLPEEVREHCSRLISEQWEGFEFSSWWLPTRLEPIQEDSIAVASGPDADAKEHPHAKTYEDYVCF